MNESVIPRMRIYDFYIRGIIGVIVHGHVINIYITGITDIYITGITGITGITDEGPKAETCMNIPPPK